MLLWSGTIAIKEHFATFDVKLHDFMIKPKHTMFATILVKVRRSIPGRRLRTGFTGFYWLFCSCIQRILS